MTRTPDDRSVAWGRVGLFYAIALGGACIVAAALALSGASMKTGVVTMVTQLIVAFAYMPLPIVAGLVVERVAKRPTILSAEKTGFVSRLPRVALVSACASLLVVALWWLVSWIAGNLMGIPGVGRLVFTPEEVLTAMAALAPGQSLAQTNMPPVWVLYLASFASALGAGFTINGLFAFGEEYGWRGVLMDELRPLGPVRANILTGVMWGLWHAPVIALGFNYGDNPLLGIPMMCLWGIPVSFILWRAREFSGSVIAPAIIHGAFNAAAGFFLILMVGRVPLLSAPVGFVGFVAASITAGIVWVVFRPAPGNA